MEKKQTERKRVRAAQLREEYNKELEAYDLVGNALENLSAETAAGIAFSKKELEARGIGNYRYDTEDIIGAVKDGDILTGIKVVLANFDLRDYYNVDVGLANEESHKIQEAINATEKGRKLFNRAAAEGALMGWYGDVLRYYYKAYQTAVAQLAVSLNKWKMYEDEAKRLNELFNYLKGGKTLEDVALYLNSRNFYDGAELRVKSNSLVFDIFKDKEKGLYSKIKEEAEVAKECLEDFVAFSKALEEALPEFIAPLPLFIDMSIRNVKEEFYTRYLVKDLSFFRSNLNERQDRGETITAADRKRALIPDYYETKPNKRLYVESKYVIKENVKKIKKDEGK